MCSKTELNTNRAGLAVLGLDAQASGIFVVHPACCFEMQVELAMNWLTAITKGKDTTN